MSPLGLLAASTAELTLRMVVSLGLMGLATLVVMKLARGRLRLGAGRAGIAVHARHQLTRNASVAVIQAGERWLLVGVTDANVSVLAEGGDLVADGPGRPRPSDRPPALEPTAAAVDQGAPTGETARESRRRGGRGPHHRPPTADGATRRDAGKRHRRADGPGRSRTSLIEALREKTVRR